jgi:hypothetical protein
MKKKPRKGAFASFRISQTGSASLASRTHIKFYPGNQLTGQPEPSGSGFFPLAQSVEIQTESLPSVQEFALPDVRFAAVAQQFACGKNSSL